MANIMVVDDDPYIRELVRLNLEREGLVVSEAEDGAVALTLLETHKADLVVVDVMMPNLSGWDLCQAIREQFDMPILLLTAMGETVDKVKGFRLGADDYLVKPFDPPELLARIKAILRRYRIHVEQSVQIGRLVLDKNRFAGLDGNREMVLPRKEFELLFMLAGYQGRTLTREQLIEDIWGYDYEGDERTVDVHVKRLRERFPEGDWGFKISTVRGLGYRLESNP